MAEVFKKDMSENIDKISHSAKTRFKVVKNIYPASIDEVDIQIGKEWKALKRRKRL